MSLELLNNPILTLLQDKGRFSYASIGVSPSGVMDEYAYLIANKMLGNRNSDNTLEISFSNNIFKVHKNTQIVITGASCEFFINDVLFSTWQTYNVKAGDIIKVGKILSGAKVYLSVKAGFDVKKEFGSNATSIKESLGGLDAKKLKKQDILPFKSFCLSPNTKLKQEYIPNYEDTLTLRVVLGYQNEFFNKEEIDKFLSTTYTISNDFNRMACKLKGKKISCNIDGIISEGIAFGSIQIPKDGQPIILLKERQTIGGYPKIGSVLSIDCFKLAQCKPTMNIKFEKITITEAQEKLRNFYLSLR